MTTSSFVMPLFYFRQVMMISHEERESPPQTTSSIETPHQTVYYYFQIKQKLITNIACCSKRLKSCNQWMLDFEITIADVCP